MATIKERPRCNGKSFFKKLFISELKKSKALNSGHVIFVDEWKEIERINNER